MKFRPCIDIHNGKVKQIVGGSLSDKGNFAAENFVSDLNAAAFASLYKDKKLSGGHIIILNPETSEYYESDVNEAVSALSEYKGGLQIGGGINTGNAEKFLKAGASHVIVTSFVFKNGNISYENLISLKNLVGKEKLVLDLSCRKKRGEFFIVTDRWQKYTDVPVNENTLGELSSYCDEFLIHAVDNEGKQSGIQEEIAQILGDFGKIPSTYAGGISSFDDINRLQTLGKNRVDFTVGSALDLFGGKLPFEELSKYKA